MQRYHVHYYDEQLGRMIDNTYEAVPITNLSRLVPGQDYRILQPVHEMIGPRYLKGQLLYYQPATDTGPNVNEGMMKFLGRGTGNFENNYVFFKIGAFRLPYDNRNEVIIHRGGGARRGNEDLFVILPGDAHLVPPPPRQTAEVLSTASSVVQQHGKEKGLQLINKNLAAAAINRRANALEFFYRSNPHYKPEGKVPPSENAAAAGAGGAAAGGKVGGGNRLTGTGRRRKTIRKRMSRRKSRKN